MLKKTILLQALFFCLFNLNAQEWSNVKLGIEIGLLDLSESGNLGLFLNLEPKLKPSENTVLGLRVGVTANSLTYENDDITQFIINEISGNGVVSIVPTFDYYWNDIKFRPNLGLGVGSYLLVTYLDVARVRTTSPSEEVIEVDVGHRIGLLLRGGFAWGKSRVGLEYNLVPKADVELPNGQKVGTVDRRYAGISIGFTIGDRKK